MKQSVVLPVEGMTCASCVARVEKTLKTVPGVETANVNLASESVSLVFDPSQTNLARLASSVDESGYKLIIPSPSTAADPFADTRDRYQKRLKREFFVALYLTIPVVAISFLQMLPFGESVSQAFYPAVDILLLAATTIVMAFPGRRFFTAAWKLVKRGTADMNSLVAVGTGAAYLYSLVVVLFPGSRVPAGFAPLYIDTACAIITLILLGRFLEARAKDRTGTALRTLLTLQPKMARVILNGDIADISIAEIRKDQVVLIRPGEKIPVDGIIITGKTYIDESMVTGESLPVGKSIGEKVVGGTINRNGSIEVRTTAVGQDTVIAHIVKLVEQAQSSKAEIQTLADSISAIFVPIVIGISIVTFFVWFLGVGLPFSAAMVNSIAVLIIACPCALGLATPAAVIVGTGRGAQSGILIKDVASMERLRRVTHIVIDKTGTLTEGKPAVMRIVPLGNFTEHTLLLYAASLEKSSEHPLSDAIVQCADRKNITLFTPDSFDSHPGMGITGTVQGVGVVVGNSELMRLNNITLPDLGKILTHGTDNKRIPVIVALDGKPAGIIIIYDPLKESSKKAVTALRRLNIEVTMATGDSAPGARGTAAEAGITNVLAGLMPAEKASHIKLLQSQGAIVAMVGDGINDAPGLAQADVGIAMGRGTDVAIETADITLMKSDLLGIVDAVILARKTFRTIQQNFFWAFVYNIIGIPLAAMGYLHPIVAAGAMAFSSVSVISNSLRLRKAKLGDHLDR